MKRQVITIDEEKCIGCGLCTQACHQGAIGLVDGKAKLLREDYCDGLGNCLPVCPTDAISFEEREVEAFVPKEDRNAQPAQGGCPGKQVKEIERVPMTEHHVTGRHADVMQSELQQWPVQIKLVPINAPYFAGASLLVAADCTAFAYANFHSALMKNKITLIGCPKLDEGDYTEKLTAIIQENDIQSVTIARMEVPCCGGLEQAVKNALQASGKFLPWRVVTITTDGNLIEV